MALHLPSLRAATLPELVSDSPAFSTVISANNSVDLLAWCLEQHTAHHGPMPAKGRNNWLAAFSFFCNERGVNQDELERESIARWEAKDFTAHEMQQTIRGIYRRESAYHGVKSWQSSNPLVPLTPAVGSSSLTSTPIIPQGVHDNLPGFLRDCTQHFAGRERDVVLTSVLAVASGCFPHLYGVYDSAQVHANLYSFVVAPAGSGKGTLAWAYKLAAPYHAELVASSRKAYAEYQQVQMQHQQLARTTRKTSSAPVPPLPQEPPFRQLYIPANNSSASIMKALADNEGRGILFETEADTLSVALKQEHGDFSHLLRKAFHHEACSYQRKTNREYYQLERPALSVVLAGTPGQLRTLIPSAEDGLFSRFLFYSFQSPATWRDVSPNGRSENLSTHFEALAAHFHVILLSVRRPVKFDFSVTQWASLNAAGRRWVSEALPDELGIVKRLGLATFRLAMILTVLRTLEQPWQNPSALLCSDTDFDISLQLAEVYRLHALHLLEARHQLRAKPVSIAKKAEQMSRVRELHAQNWSYSRIEEEVGVPKATISRWINQSA